MAQADSGLLLSYYGDDLTGSTDVMEALELGGVSTVLFMREPDAALAARFGDRRAIGLAGTSRSETPAWMDVHLKAAFAWLKTLRAPLCHYKICSTFDSSPAVGSIGRAIEIGRDVFGQASVPMIVGAPQLKRWTAFGNLFAGFRGEVFRIDRHPVMSRHPVTPMDEADLLLHLSRQTGLSAGLVSVADLGAEAAAASARLLEAGTGVILYDVDGAQTQRAAGAELWRIHAAAGPFVVGSSGVEYALLTAWKDQGLALREPRFSPPQPQERIAVVSGSVSPTTERQIRHAMQDGFAGIALDPVALVRAEADATIKEAVRQGDAVLAAGKSVILYTALGPQADRGREIDGEPGARHRLGRSLGKILAQLCRRQKLRRAVIAGGDTSSHALGQLGVDALTIRLPLPETPGSPLCVAHGRGDCDGLEIALKGGQVGSDRYFSVIRDGGR